MKALIKTIFTLTLLLNTTLADDIKLPPLSVSVATLCDAATDNNGKLTIKGTFDTLYAASFPVVHKNFSLALRITTTKKEPRERELKLKFLSPEKNQF